MTTVITATGKEFPTDSLVTIPKPKMLYVRLLGETAETVNEVFQNPEETKVVRYRDLEYNGYTVFRSLFDEGDALKVGLEYAIDNNT